MVQVNPEKVRKLVSEIFIRNGLPEKDARTVTDALLDANLSGRASHGVLRTKNYIDRLHAGGAKAKADVRIVEESETTALIDGDNALGMVVSELASRVAREKAERYGVSCVAVKNSNHYGAAAYWTEMIAGNDMIAFSCSNVEPLMAPPGGKDVALGTNPLCVYVPSKSYGPLCLDIATSTVAQGKLFDYQLKHQELGAGWAVDKDGIPTTDPDKAVYLTPFGSHKGYGLAVMIEIMCSLLTGGGFGREINGMYSDLDKPNKLSHCFMAVKIDRFRPVDEFLTDVDRFVDFLHSIPTAEGQRVYFPGEIEQINKARAQNDGMQIPENLVEQLTDLGKAVGMENPDSYFVI